MEIDFWSERRAETQRLQDWDTDRSLKKRVSICVSNLDGVLTRRPIAVPEWLSCRIFPYGSIQNGHLAPSPNAPLVVLIQDAHDIEEAQRNTAAILAGFSGQSGVSRVGLAGATVAFDFEPYRAWPNKDLTKQIAGSF